MDCSHFLSKGYKEQNDGMEVAFQLKYCKKSHMEAASATKEGKRGVQHLFPN